MAPDLKLISMDEIKAEEVKWLWYPYLPRGKLTIVQGDPVEGKTTFVLAVIAALTRGETLPESEKTLEPLNVIYQTAGTGWRTPSSHGWMPPVRTAPGCWSSTRANRS